MADETDIREGHDRIAKRLFANAGVVADLLRNCLPNEMLPAFDASTLRRFPEERVDSRLALRRADIAWEFKLLKGPRVVLLIEAQSTPDEAMASRMMAQCCMHGVGRLSTQEGAIACNPAGGVLHGACQMARR